MNYKNIKIMLRAQIKNDNKSLWTWDKKNNNFTMLYGDRNKSDKIYTANELLNEIEKENEQETKNV